MDADETAEPPEPSTVSRSVSPSVAPAAPARVSSVSSIPPPSWQVRRARRKRWGRSQLAIGIVVLLFFVIVGATITRERMAGAPSDSPSVFRGAYLGMTAPELRHRFAPGVDGHWAASTSQVGEEALVWTADAAGAQIAHAAFEFHDRLLVAMRADLSPGAPEAAEPPRTITPITVRALAGATAASPGSLTILARDCPTHAPEVARLLGNAK